MIFTIGHSNHSSERFRELLAGAGIDALADLRSAPMSRWAPQFNKETLAETLKQSGIAYVYLGKELGGRPKDAALLKQGNPDYEAMAQADVFRAGIARLVEGAKNHRVALMCAEKDPLDCHRFALIARHLAAQGMAVSHILADGSVEPHPETEARSLARKGGPDLFGM